MKKQTHETMVMATITLAPGIAPDVFLKKLKTSFQQVELVPKLGGYRETSGKKKDEFFPAYHLVCQANENPEKLLEAAVHAGARIRDTAQKYLIQSLFGNFLTLHDNEPLAPVRFDRRTLHSNSSTPAINSNNIFRMNRNYPTASNPYYTAEFIANNGNKVYASDAAVTMIPGVYKHNLQADLPVIPNSLAPSALFNMFNWDGSERRNGYLCNRESKGWLADYTFWGNGCIADSTAPRQVNELSLYTVDIVALRSTSSGLYLCAEGGGGRELVVNRGWRAQWEAFYLVYHPSNTSRVRLISCNGAAVYEPLSILPSTTGFSSVEIRSAVQELYEGEWFRMDWVTQPFSGIITLRSPKGGLVTDVNTNRLITSPGAGTQFYLEYI